MSRFPVKEFLAVVIVVAVHGSAFQFRITILTCFSEKQLLKGPFVASFLKPRDRREV